MTLETSASAAINDSAPLHCQYRSASGRRFCRLPVSDTRSGLCSKHAADHQKDLDQADLAASLIGDTQEFRDALAINHSLGELYKLQARNKISPRRAAVMAYTANLLLRTLPVIAAEKLQSQQEDMTLDVSDWPGPPDENGIKGPAVHRRQVEYHLNQLRNLKALEPLQEKGVLPFLTPEQIGNNSLQVGGHPPAPGSGTP